MRSAPHTCKTGPSAGSVSIRSRRTEDRPMALGRNGDRVAKTPIRLLPPSLGGLTVGLHVPPAVSENPQMSQRCVYSSIPLITSCWRQYGSNTISAVVSTSPLCLGIPNFVGKSLRIYAIGFNSKLCSFISILSAPDSGETLHRFPVFLEETDSRGLFPLRKLPRNRLS